VERRALTIGFPHLLTFGLGALWVRYAFDAEAWWWIRVVVGTFGVFVLGVGLGDILWCRWHKFRFSRIGVFFDRRFSLIGEGERGEARRHIAVLERDQELGRLPAGAVLNYDADGNRLDHTRSTPDA
jgi:hypothetical protein